MTKLNKGDSISLTLGISMPTGDRSEPWIRADATSTTTIGHDETYKEAKNRLYNEVYTRLDHAINKLAREVQKSRS